MLQMSHIYSSLIFGKTLFCHIVASDMATNEIATNSSAKALLVEDGPTPAIDR